MCIVWRSDAQVSEVVLVPDVAVDDYESVVGEICRRDASITAVNLVTGYLMYDADSIRRVAAERDRREYEALKKQFDRYEELKAKFEKKEG